MDRDLFLRAKAGCAMRCHTWTTERDHRLEAAQAATSARSHAQAAELLLTENRDRALSGQFRLSQNLELLRCSDERFQASRWRGVLSRCWTDVGYQVP